MKVNFYISCETSEETKACLDFIREMEEIRKTDRLCARPDVLDEPDDSSVTNRRNVNPGEPSIGKIGEATKMAILSDLANGRQPPHPKYTEHLKLLWKRGEVKWDGQEYYL